MRVQISISYRDLALIRAFTLDSVYDLFCELAFLDWSRILAFRAAKIIFKFLFAFTTNKSMAFFALVWAQSNLEAYNAVEQIFNVR